MASFDAIYRRDHLWLVMRVARLNGVAEPEDVAADSFLRCWTSPDLLDLRDPRAMLFTIAKRLVWRAFRRKKLEDGYLADLRAMPIALQPDEENRHEALSVLQAIDEVLDGEPWKVKAAFIYSYVDERTYADIAHELGVSVTMVRKYLAKALAACAIAMAESA